MFPLSVGGWLGGRIHLPPATARSRIPGTKMRLTTTTSDCDRGMAGYRLRASAVLRRAFVCCCFRNVGSFYFRSHRTEPRVSRVCSQVFLARQVCGAPADWMTGWLGSNFCLFCHFFVVFVRLTYASLEPQTKLVVVVTAAYLVTLIFVFFFR